MAVLIQEAWLLSQCYSDELHTSTILMSTFRKKKKAHQNGCPSILALYTDTVLVSYNTNRKLHLVNQMIGLSDFLNSSNNF